jgi:hypothetical protein
LTRRQQPGAPLVLIDVPAGSLGGGSFEIASDEDGLRHFGTWTAAEVAA